MTTPRAIDRFSGGQTVFAEPFNDTQTELRRLAGRLGTVVLLAALSIDGNLTLPAGSDSQRPAAPVAGQVRFNSTSFVLEWYNGTEWVTADLDTSRVIFETLQAHGDLGPGQAQVALGNHSHPGFPPTNEEP